MFISKNYDISSYPTLENCLFGAFSLAKNTNIDQYKYFVFCIGFGWKGTFSFGNGFGKNVIIFGVDMSSSVHVDNKKKYMLILGKGSTQELERTLTLKENWINFTGNNKPFCLSLHYNGANNDFYVNGTEIIKFKAKDSEIVATSLCLGNISKGFSVDNMKKIGLKDMFMIQVLIMMLLQLIY